MGTSQDYRVAAEEGATVVRIGTSLYRGASPAGAADRRVPPRRARVRFRAPNH